jgi:hypothetical protein
MKRALSLVAAIAVVLAGGPARADEGLRAEAKSLAGLGDAQFYAGHCENALPLWRKAEATFHATTILLRIARCQAQLGKVVDASSTLGAIVEEHVRADAPPAFFVAREEARRELPSVRARVATLRLLVRAGSADAPVVVDVDGVTAPRGATSFPLDPGDHVVHVRAGDDAWRRDVHLAPGELLACDVPLWVRVTPTPRPQRTVGLATFGAGVAALSVGLGAAIAGASTNTPERATALTSVAAGGIGGGVALVVAGGFLLVTEPRPAPPLRLSLSPTSARLSVDF